MSTRNQSIVIVGAGPVGLSMAIALARAGTSCVVIERRTGNDLLHPTANHLGLRQMEVLRQWGLEDRVVAAGRSPELPDRRYWMDRLDGRVIHELERHRGGTREPLPHSPCHETWISKNSFDPILLATALALPAVQIRFATQVGDLSQDSTGVSLSVSGADGAEEIQADYVIACDGAASTVRMRLGVPVVGPIRTGIVLRSVWFTAPDLGDLLPPGGLHFALADPGGMLVALDRPGEYRIHTPSLGAADPMTAAEGAALVRAAAGAPDLEMEVHSCAPWELSVTLAERWRVGRVFLAGDAAKAGTPFGGLGMGFGILDAHNLAWRLNAVVAGWGGDRLLDSYESERRPAAVRLLTYQGAVLDADPPHLDSRLVPPMAGPDVSADGPHGDAARETYRSALIAHNQDHYDNVGIDLDQRYEASSVVIGDGTVEPPWDTHRYAPRIRAGHRFPHVVLDDGRSTLDLFGDGFVLLTSAGASVAVLAEAAAAAGMPLVVHSIDARSEPGLDQPTFVLVRPDGHVAWAGDELPGDAGALIATITGSD